MCNNEYSKKPAAVAIVCCKCQQWKPLVAVGRPDDESHYCRECFREEYGGNAMQLLDDVPYHEVDGEREKIKEMMWEEQFKGSRNATEGCVAAYERVMQYFREKDGRADGDG